jgi:hypothetical protein
MISDNDFKKIRKLKEMEINSTNLKIGDIFVSGKNMMEQLNTKKIGDNVSYYEVIDIKDNGNIVYMLKIDTMEEQKNDSKNN